VHPVQRGRGRRPSVRKRPACGLFSTLDDEERASGKNGTRVDRTPVSRTPASATRARGVPRVRMSATRARGVPHACARVPHTRCGSSFDAPFADRREHTASRP
jgi:hypothetical protein